MSNIENKIYLSFHIAQDIIRRNKEVRQQVLQLRRQLLELEKEAEKLGLVEDPEISRNGSKVSDKKDAILSETIE
jgi:hypothetical protein